MSCPGKAGRGSLMAEGGAGGWGFLYSEVQCIIGNFHMRITLNRMTDTTEKLPSHNFVGGGNNANLYTWFPASQNYKLPCIMSLTVQISVFGAHDHSVSRMRGTIKSLARYFGMRNSSWWKVGWWVRS